MGTELPADFFAQLQATILADIRGSVRARTADASCPPAYGFVIFFHPMHGHLGWRFFDASTDPGGPVAGFTYGPGHPDGPRFDVADCVAESPTSSTTDELLQTYSDARAEGDYEVDDDRIEELLIQCIDSLASDFAAMPTTPDFVAFASDIDLGAADLVDRTVPAERRKLVFYEL